MFAKPAIKQVDRLPSNAGVVPWDLFGPWVREVVGVRDGIVAAMDRTDFDADDQSTLALHFVTRHGRATPLIWLTVDKDELKKQRNDLEEHDGFAERFSLDRRTVHSHPPIGNSVDL